MLLTPTAVRDHYYNLIETLKVKQKCVKIAKVLRNFYAAITKNMACIEKKIHHVIQPILLTQCVFARVLFCLSSY